MMNFTYKFNSEHPDFIDRFNNECCLCIQQLGSNYRNIMEATSRSCITSPEVFLEALERERNRQSRIILKMIEWVNMGYNDIQEYELDRFCKIVKSLGWDWHDPYSHFERT